MAFNFLEGEAIHAALRFATINWPEFVTLLSQFPPDTRMKLVARLGHAQAEQSLLNRIQAMSRNAVVNGVNVGFLTVSDLLAIHEALRMALRYWGAFELFVEDQANRYSDPEMVLSVVGRSDDQHSRLLSKVHALLANTDQSK